MAAIRKLTVYLAAAAMLCLAAMNSAVGQDGDSKAQEVVQGWYGLVLKLVRHTPTYSPPVASRAFAYLGVTAYEAAASGDPAMHSLAGQLNALEPLPKRDPGAQYDHGLVMHAALASAVRNYFGNTGPTGQRVMERFEEKLRASASAGLPRDVAERSEAYGRAVAGHILAWSQTDGGAVIENLGFPAAYKPGKGSADWVPTSTIQLQQKPLLPQWGTNRTFAMRDGKACPLPPPPAYGEEKGSAFYKEALEVFETGNNLTAEQKAIARFWSDDPMLSPTPPGHWISIALQIFERDDVAFDKRVDTLARLGIALADAFIGCWQTKFEYDLLRPVTYIRRLMDPKWEPLLITPPFPEYPSGHSTQSGAAAAVLTHAFGGNFAFDDATHERDGIAPRTFASFDEAAREAALSRLYGGIHFRAAIERGLDQGRCIGAHAVALKTRH